MKYEEGTLNYLIVIKRPKDNSVIARFNTNIDRDDCMSFLQDRYEDCTFVAVDE